MIAKQYVFNYNSNINRLDFPGDSLRLSCALQLTNVTNKICSVRVMYPLECSFIKGGNVVQLDDIIGVSKHKHVCTHTKTPLQLRMGIVFSLFTCTFERCTILVSL